MITSQEFVSSQLLTLQQTQYILSRAEAVASSHRLKANIKEQTAKLDGLESQFQILSVQRGWGFEELEPVKRLMLFFSHRYRSDSAIAEYLISLYNRDSIPLLKLYNRWDGDDPAVRDLFQKFMDQYTVGIRQMQHFL